MLRRCMIFTFALLAICVMGVFSFAADKDAQPSESAKPVATAAPPKLASENTGKSTVSPITKGAVNDGALSCAARVEQVVDYLSAGNNGVGAYLQVSPENPDRSLMTISMEVEFANMPSSYAGASFAPNQANGCGASYEVVTYWPMQCSDVAQKQYAGLKSAGVVKKDISVLDGNDGIKVFLMPAGASGCVSIKKEIVK